MITLVDCAPSEKLVIKYPSARHASLSEVMPNVGGMKTVVLLNDAYLDHDRVRSIRELKESIGMGDLAKLKTYLATRKAPVTLIEGEKMLPSSLIEALKGDYKAMNI